MRARVIRCFVFVPAALLSGGAFAHSGDFASIPIHAPASQRPSSVAFRMPQPLKHKPALIFTNPEASTPARPNVRRQVLVKSWAAQTEVRTVDPWHAFFKGFDEGEHVVIEKQLPSMPIKSLSQAPLPIAGGDQPKMAARGLLREALRFKKVLALGINNVKAPHNNAYDGALPWSATAEKEGTQQLEIHTPLRIRAYANGEQTAPTVYTTVKGLATDKRSYDANLAEPGEPAQIRRLTETKSGELQQHYAAWMRPENVRVSPAYTDERGRPTANFVALAAFPIGARIRVTNLEMERKDPKGATTELQQQRRRSSKTGSIVGRLPVSTPGAEYRLEVELTGRYDAAKTVKLTSTFKLPDPTSKEVQAGGIALYPFTTTSAPALTEAKENGIGNSWYYNP